jgi:hypothetical protein
MPYGTSAKMTAFQMGKQKNGHARSSSSESLGSEVSDLLSLFVPGGRADLSLGLKSGNSSSVFPSHFLRKSSEDGVFAVWLETENSESLRDNNSLELIVGWWDTFEDLKSLEGSSTTGSLVWEHASDCSPENA